MVCWSWWILVLVLVSAAALGFIVHFLWHWWLLSRPDARRGGPPLQGPRG